MTQYTNLFSSDIYLSIDLSKSICNADLCFVGDQLPFLCLCMASISMLEQALEFQ